MKSYRELEVWKKGVNLVVDVYEIIRNFPKEDSFVLSKQIQRSSTSIPANIAEGWGRSTRKEYIQFLMISRGSLLELETHLIVAHKLKYISPKDLEILLQKTGEIGRMLNGLINSLKKS